MNKEQKIWFLVSFVSGVIFMSIMTLAIYDIRFEYGLYILFSTYGVMFTSFIMYALTQYISTRDIMSTLARKILGNDV